MGGIFDSVKEDITVVFLKDPAARNSSRSIADPGVLAVWIHRVSHFFWTYNFLFLARFISQISRWLTLIEIHPGATIGRRFFIDHGASCVIGETTIIGDDVLMYKGAVLGGTTSEKRKRHPTIEDGVVIGTNAIVLGDITIGHHSKLGAGSVSLKSVPPYSTVVGVPGRIVKMRQANGDVLDHGNLPDPILDIMEKISKRQDELDKRLGEVDQKPTDSLLSRMKN